MKLIDRIILSIVGATLVMFIILNAALTLKILGGILLCLYFIFITLHLALCIPFMLAIMSFNDVYERVTLQRIKEHSIILNSLLFGVLLISWLVLIYFGTPLLAAMLLNVSFSIPDAILFLHNL